MLKKKIFIVVLIFGVLAACLCAEDSQKILDIEMQGNKLAESRLIVIASRLEIGDFFTAEKARAALDKLYSLGLFELVKIEQESVADGLKIRITVTENPYIRKVQFVGNKKLNEDELRDVMTVREDQFVRRARIVETRFKFEELYKEKGYYLAEISAELEAAEDEPNKQTLIFTIEEGNKVKIDKIYFDGVSGVSEKKLRKAMKIGRAHV